MKWTTFLFIVLSATASLASVDSKTDMRQFEFKYQWQNESYTFTTQAKSLEEALPQAAQACFSHFRDGKKMEHEAGLDLIDICVNPKTKS